MLIGTNKEKIRWKHGEDKEKPRWFGEIYDNSKGDFKPLSGDY